MVLLDIDGLIVTIIVIVHYEPNTFEHSSELPAACLELAKLKSFALGQMSLAPDS